MKLTLPNNMDFTLYYHLMDALFITRAQIKAPFDDYVDLLPDKEFSILHTSTPNIKMYYPEPFIASPTFINDDIWFLHITIYQYWLWFIFISLIVFFFLGFLITLRWCNIRHRPARETRGVSRSKCGDLITATVPVSWAASIIIHESTDAIEFADGFGSTDVAIGIRAYQWGWEYYYPKGLNLTNNLNDSTFMGNSLTDSLTTSDSDNFFFKHSTTNSDFLTHTHVTDSTQFLSLTSNQTNKALVDFSFGGNKLIARRATNLLESNSQLTNDNFFLSTTPLDNGLRNFFNNYFNYVFEYNYPTKPTYFNHQLSFFSSKAAFFNALNFLNWHDQNPLSFVWGGALTLNYSLSAKLSYVMGFNSTNLSKLTNVLSRPTTGWIKEMSAVSASWLLTNNLAWGSTFIADQDFKRWLAFDLLDDIFWYTDDWSPTTSSLFLADSGDSSWVDTTYLVPGLSSDLTVIELYYPFTNYQNNPIQTTFGGYPLNVFLLLNNYWLNSALTSLTSVWYKELSNNLLGLGTQVLLDIKNTNHVSFTDTLFSFIGTTHSFSKTTPTLYSLSPGFDLLAYSKNLLTYSNAFWKVFKPLLDEQRGSFYSLNFTNTESQLPILGQAAPSLLGLAQKNKNTSFVSLLTMRHVLNNRNLIDSSVFLTRMVPFFSFPFNLAFESDSLRYAWFDWYSTRNSIVAKAMDTSVFNLHASRDYAFSFTSPLSHTGLTNQYDNYFLKYANARKFYLPVNYYLPFFFNLQKTALDGLVAELPSNFKFGLYLQTLQLTNQRVFNNWIPRFKFGWSASLTNLRPFTGPLNLYNGGIDQALTLADIKARHLYITYSLSAPVKLDINNTKYIVTGLSKNLQKDLTSTAVAAKAPIWPVVRTSRTRTLTTPLVSQYRPLRKGIVNMIRIQADKAIAMPTDTRLQILAVSKDIIHSWAIPAAGIKIDCIPGYSSHRVAIFTLSGIYWGQCMEICGRFHHWMPIVVYFLRRDLFCLWCIHFIFKNNQTNSTLQSLTHDTTDTSPLVSLNPNINWAYLG